MILAGATAPAAVGPPGAADRGHDPAPGAISA